MCLVFNRGAYSELIKGSVRERTTKFRKNGNRPGSFTRGRIVPVAHAVKKAIPQISETISFCVSAIKNGNRIIYIGAGTSGRLGVLDASEIPPTFSAPSEWFTGVIAGGEKALRKSVEGAEDIQDNGVQDLRDAGITNGDVLIGISTREIAMTAIPGHLGGRWSCSSMA